ncbi:MAG: hypothetical protein ACO1QR_08315, partial [Chthoniobacteraceae bacterium]
MPIALIEFAHPWYLLLLLAVVPLVWLPLRRSVAGLSPGQQRLSVALRVIILSLLIAALAGLRVLLPSSQVAAVFVVDDSASISETAAAGARQWIETSLAALNAGRESAQGLELAELTGLAGDHAAAAGRLSNA